MHDCEHHLTPGMLRILREVLRRSPLVTLPSVERKTCKECGQSRPIKHFYKDRAKRKPICRDCWKAKYRHGPLKRATIDDLLDMAQVRALTGYARSTVYDLMKKCRFPRPCSPPRARVKWRKADIDAYIAKLHEPPPEPEQVRMARINALAYAPRRGEKRRGRPPAAPPSGAAPQLAYMASPLDWEHEQALRRRLGLDQDDDAKPMKPIRSTTAI